MQHRARLFPLVRRRAKPVAITRFSGGHGARPGSHGVQDRSIERRVNNLMVGHSGPLLNTTNLTAGLRNGYGAKREIVQ